jgi:hypothetical protein
VHAATHIYDACVWFEIQNHATYLFGLALKIKREVIF